ncbi:MAG: ribbon-helix-helix protein, CopG family [Deltaproteobacteria bacterium]|nr:ribbon-helix-helix protein, CopG family [Deltaproteobacteria bacterium]
MRGSVKFAISIPDKEFKELESFREKEGLSRSRFILQAIKLWKETKERERLVRIYEEGYKRVPEDLRDIEAWEKASLNVFSKEDW